MYVRVRPSSDVSTDGREKLTVSSRKREFGFCESVVVNRS